MQRRTRQRDAIWNCFVTEQRPLTPQQAFDMVAAHAPAIGMATVYRAIHSFVENGTLRPVAIGSLTHYEPADRGHHHHFLCQTCDRTFCVRQCPISDRYLAPEGFTVFDHELIVKGRCPDCAQRSEN